jgi:DNA polymerase III alpha subunit
LKPEAALLIKGRVRIEENARTKVVVSEAKPLESVSNGARPELLIRLKIEPETMNRLQKIEGIIESSPGENPVIFELTRAGDFRARLRPRRTRKVKADRDLMARLREVCGEDPVLLEKTAGGNGTP